MMSLHAMVAINQEIALQAAERELRPYVPWDADELDGWPPFPFPGIGYLEPDGWERTEARWFIDKTGCGLEEEPALTCEQFKKLLRSYISQHPGHGFAVTEEGEFQAVVGAFRPIQESQA